MEVLTTNAMQLLEQRYLLKNEEAGKMEDPESLFRRVSACVASAEKEGSLYWEQVFFEMMSNLLFLPNSPTLMNAGLPNGQLSACFVLPVKDSLEGVFSALTNAAAIHKSGGGTGYNFSNLRPSGSAVGLKSGVASGPISFMRIFDEATARVKQGGKRRGANMGILNVDHPDIVEFIKAKGDGMSLQNFNLSVGITDKFMKALEKGEDWELHHPLSNCPTRILSARSLWDDIVKMAWKTGDPGLIFLDTINRENPLAKNGEITSTNPCGEVPLQDFESCNLGSLNLARMLRENNGNYEIDWERLGSTVHKGVRFLDNVITVNHYVLPEVKKITLANRKIGLGVMGWAEMLLKLDIPYASEEAVGMAGKLMKFIKEESYKASEILAEKKGVFPAWQESRFFPDRKMRNATCNSIAPTGSLAIIADTSYGIEPLYALSYSREGILGNMTQKVLEPCLEERLSEMGLWDDKTKRQVVETGSIANASWIPAPLRAVFQTSLEIDWTYHLRHQQAFQQYTDNAVSKTINLPEHTPPDEIDRIFRTAWEYNLKGITVYRDKSKTRQVLNRSCKSVSSAC